MFLGEGAQADRFQLVEAGQTQLGGLGVARVLEGREDVGVRGLTIIRFRSTGGRSSPKCRSPFGSSEELPAGITAAVPRLSDMTC